jgi:hypothetical protein
MSDGWAVEVQTKMLGGSGHTTQIFYARFADRIAAEEAVKKHIHATSDVIVRANKPVSASTFDGMNVKPGTVSQW